MSTLALSSSIVASNITSTNTGTSVASALNVTVSTATISDATTIADSSIASSVVASSSKASATARTAPSTTAISARSQGAALPTLDVSTTSAQSQSISKQTNVASSSSVTSTTQDTAPNPAPTITTSSSVSSSISSTLVSVSSSAVTSQTSTTSASVSSVAVSTKIDDQSSSSSTQVQNSTSTGKPQTTSLTSASDNARQSSLRLVSLTRSTFTSSATSPSSTSSKESQQLSVESLSSFPSSTNSASSSTRTSVIPISVAHANSTFSTAVKVTVTSHGSTFLTTPDLITSTVLSSEANGSTQTLTSVFANPTTSTQTDALGSTSFWNKKGVVAGTFLVVALAIIGSILGTLFCIRRRRSRQISPSGLLTASDFRRFSGPPEMMEQPTTYQAVRNYGTSRDDPQRHLMAPSISNGSVTTHEEVLLPPGLGIHSQRVAHNGGALNLTGINTTRSDLRSYSGPFSDYHRYITTGDTRIHVPQRESIGIAYTPDTKAGPKLEAEHSLVDRTPSPVPSSPSVYPPSLPPVPERDEDDYLFYERETKPRPESRPPTRPTTGQESDTRNPFLSPQDPTGDTSTKRATPIQLQIEQGYRPLTPPDSSSGHSPNSPSISPEEQGQAKNPYTNTFLGRSVSVKGTEPTRPKRNPLRMSASGSSINI